MSMTVKQVIERCAELGQDTGLEVYKGFQWVEWINDAQRAVTLVRPDAKSDALAFSLSNDAKQELPDGSRRLLGISRNMGNDGLTPGKAIRGPVPTEELDGQDPDWITRTGPVVKEFTYSEHLPTIFWINPIPSSMPHYVELLVAKTPSDVADQESVLDLGDIYVPAIIEWCMYRAYSRDSERSPNWTRAGRHFTAFFNLLKVKMQRDMAVSPKVIENTR